MTAESASRYAIEAIRFHKQEPIEELTRFASQAVEDYKEKLKISVARIHRINKRQFDRKDWENLEMTPATYQGVMNACDEILKLIDSIK